MTERPPLAQRIQAQERARAAITASLMQDEGALYEVLGKLDHSELLGVTASLVKFSKVFINTVARYETHIAAREVSAEEVWTRIAMWLVSQEEAL